MRQKKNQRIIKLVQLSDKLKSETAIFKSFGDFLSNYGHYFLFSLIALIIFFIFNDFIILKKLYLFKDFSSDSINFNYPLYYSLADYITKEGFPKWSFNQGMGQNIFPVNYIDPFLLFIILMGKNYVYYTIFYAEILKILCAGFFFYLFLKKVISSGYAAVMGGVLYSFSGFIILGGQWSLFSTQAVYVALLLYSFEKLYQNDNWILFPISVFLIGSYQPLDLFFIGSFLIIYIIFRLCEDNVKDRRKIPELFTKIILLGITGVALSSFFLVNGLQIMMESPRGSGALSYSHALFSTPIFGLESFGQNHYLTALMRFFSNDIMGIGNNFRGWNSYLEAPLFYCGLISLILLPHFINLSDKRKKTVYFLFLIIFILPVIFPFFRYSFWLFTGDYYRIFSLFVAVVVVLISLKSIDEIDSKSKVDIKITLGTLLVLIIFLYYPYKDSQIIDKNIRDMVAIFLIIYSVLIYLIQFRYVKNIVKIMLLTVIIAELICFHYAAVNKRPVILGKEISRKVGYNDYTVDAVAFIKSNDKTFFRINKDYYSGGAMNKGQNDAKVQNFYGTSSYHNFNQINYIKFLLELEIVNRKDEPRTRYCIGLTKHPLLHSFASIKYALTKKQNPHLLNFGYDLFDGSFGDVKVLKNKFVLPLGFTYEKYIPLNDFKSLSQNQKMITLYKAVVIDDSVYGNFGNLAKFDLSEIPESYSDKEYFQDIKLLSRNALNISEHGQNKIAGTINTDKDKLLFFSIPFDKGWNMKVDGKRINPMMVNIGFIGVPVEKGLHSVELSFTPVFFYTGAVISIIAMILFVCLIVFKYRRDRKTAVSL
ncbi:MAG: YfhO family protein [Syntrophaceae bacterium]|nr:YfhO family protein [Syntrophaceae bacterium]